MRASGDLGLGGPSRNAGPYDLGALPPGPLGGSFEAGPSREPGTSAFIGLGTSSLEETVRRLLL